MSDFDDAVAGLRANRPQYRDIRIKVTGYKNPDGTVNDNPLAGAQPGYVWVYGYPRGGNVQVIAGPAINPQLPNVPVWVGQNHANQAVAFDLVTDDNAVRQFGNALGQAATPLVPIENWNQPVPGSLIGGGRVLPPQGAGLLVFIEGLVGFGWDGNDLPIDGADVPTNPNEFCWAVWYMPAYNGTPVAPDYLTTTPVIAPTRNDLLLSDAYNLALPAGVTRLGAVSLATGQTVVNGTTSRFVDLRRDFVPEQGVYVNTAGGADGDVPTYVASSNSYILAPQAGGGGALARFDQQIAGVGGQAYFEFTSIPNTGTDLLLSFTGRTTNGANQNLLLRLGTGGTLDTGSNYNYELVQGSGATVSATQSTAQAQVVVGALPGTGVTAGWQTRLSLELTNYALGTLFRTFSAKNFYPTSPTALLNQSWEGLWANTGAIDILRIYPGAGNFVEGSICTLWIRT